MTLSVPAIHPRNAKVAGALKACLDILSELCALKSMAEDWDVLQAKLDVERTLLLQWSDRVKLFENVYDKCLDDLGNHFQIVQLFTNTLTLLMDKPKLNLKYHLMAHEQEESLPDATYLMSSPVLSRPRLEHFNNEFLRLRLPVMELPKSSPPSTTPFLRVATCSVGFERLVKEIARLVDSLTKLVNSPDCLECASQMATEDVRRCKRMDDLRHVRDAAKGARDTISQSADELLTHLATKRVLKNLRFRGMTERRVNLRDPHPQSFQWAFRGPAVDADWDDLAEWLVSGSDMYWVCGKAGAGKSTFLKHLFDNPNTRRHLAVWGEDEPVSLGSYFFWSQGAALQRTRDGMARVVLHHILSEIPSIIPQVLPGLWSYAYGGIIFESHESLPAPSIAEVRDAFEKLEDPGLLDRKFCFIVDALDEYAGDESRAVDFIQRLSRSPKIKVITSSRPHPAFVELFADTPKMNLHELNGGDILHYVQDKVDAHPYMRVLRDVDETIALILLETLAEKADGIFLWAVLGTMAYLKGFDAYEDFRALEDRIHAIPEELPELYRHMLGLVDQRYRAQAAKVLRTCHKSKRSRSDEGERGRIWTVGMAAVNAKGMDFDNYDAHSDKSLQARHRQCLTLENRLANRCGGLLEVIRCEPDEVNRCFCGASETHLNHDKLIDSSIEFIHRTAFEWFGDLDSSTVPWAELQEGGFPEHAALASVSWQQSRLSQELGAPFCRADIDLSTCMANLQQSETFTPRFAKMMLKKIKELVVETRRKRGGDWHAGFCSDLRGEITERLETLYFAVGMGMVNFVDYYIRENPSGGSMREMELTHGLQWYKVALDRTLVAKVLEPYYETIQSLAPQGEMLLWLARNECPVPRKELERYVAFDNLDSYGSLAIIGEPLG